MSPGIPLNEQCYQIANGQPWLALLYAVRATRWQQIANWQITPDPDEQIPAEVWRARNRTAEAAAAHA